jgi:hypothetical protein
MSYTKKDFLYEAIKYNMEFLYNTAGNFKDRYKNKIDSFKNLKQKIGSFLKDFNPTYQISNIDLTVIEEYINAFTQPTFVNIHFKNDYSIKFSKFNGILQNAINENAEYVNDSITSHFAEKNKIDFNNLTLQMKKDIFIALEKNKKRYDQVNRTTELILREVNHFEQYKTKSETIDILEICSLLLILILQAQSHENHIENVLKDTNKLIKKKNYSDDDIQEILSIKKAFSQNTKKVNDIRAIRNAVGHASFKITEKSSVYTINISSDLTGYNINLAFSRKELGSFCQDYVRFIDIQELIVRVALLKSQMKIYTQI